MPQTSTESLRLVRRLGSGRHADVVLATRDESAVDADDDAPPETIAIKRRRDGDDVASLREADALWFARGDHVVRLLDLGTDENGHIELHLERLVGPTLSRLCAQRGPLAAGECVTVLAPIAATLARVHAAGVTHGGLRADAVLFDDRMAPVLVGFGGASVATSSVVHADAVADDLEDFRRLAAWLLSQNPACHDIVDWVLAVDEDRWLELFVEALFGMAAPMPVSLRTVPIESVMPTRLIAGEPAPVPQGHSWAAVLPDSIASRMEAEVDRVVALWARFRASASTVRPRWWGLGALGIGAMGLAVAILLGGIAGPAPLEDTAPVAGEPTPSPAGADPVASGDPAHAAVLGDDPVAAFVVLADARLGCLRELSTLCLDDVDHAGSVAQRMDVMLIAAIRDRGTIPPTPVMGAADVVLIERWGDSVLLGLTQKDPEAQSLEVLLMRTSDGWRIRDYPDSWSVSSD